MSCSKAYIAVLLFVKIFFAGHCANSRPYIYLFIPVESHTQSKVLPFTLSGIEGQNYPKSKISIHVLFDHYTTNFPDNSKDERVQRNNKTFHVIESWTKLNQQSFNDIHLEINDRDCCAEPSELFAGLSQSMGLAWERAQALGAEYFLLIDGNVILANETALDILVETECTKTSPRARPTHPRLGNSKILDALAFITKKSTPQKIDYMPLKSEATKYCILAEPKILKRNVLGLPLLENLKQIFSVDPILIEPNEKYGITIYSTEGTVWGYMLPRIDRDDLRDIDLDLMDLELNASLRGPWLPESDTMDSFIERPNKDKLGVDQVYIINLERKIQRKKEMTKRCEIVGIDAEFWSAVDGEKLKNDTFQLEGIHIIMEELVDIGRPMTYGEVGCFLSHYQIWQRALQSNYERIIVLEDDVTFARDFKREWMRTLTILDSYEAIHGPYDLVYLGRRLLSPYVDKPTEFTGLVIPGFSYCLHGYLITRTGIEKVMANHPLDKMVPVDYLIPILYDSVEITDANYDLVVPYFPNRTLKALSVDPLLVLQAFKFYQLGHTSDTTWSEKIKTDGSHSQSVG